MLTNLVPDIPQFPAADVPSDRLLALEARLSNIERGSVAVLASWLQFFETLNKEGALTISDAYIKATKGIAFPATDVASSDANTLDDYEETAFTPILLGATTAGTQTYNAANTMARATKIGRLVAVEGTVILTAKDAATAGNIRIGGLPYTVAATTPGGGVAVTLARNVDLSAGYSQFSLYAIAGTTQLGLIQNGDNVGEANVTAAAIGNATAIGFGGIYTI